MLVTRRDELIRLYVNGSARFSALDEGLFAEALTLPALTLATHRRRVLIVGGAEGLALREVLRLDEVEEVVQIDVDGDLMHLASTDPSLRRVNRAAYDDPRVRAVAVEAEPSGLPDETIWMRNEHRVALHAHRLDAVGRVRVLRMPPERVLSGAEGSFDAAILALPEPRNTELARLYTPAFFDAIGERLHPGAVIVVQAPSRFYAPKAFLCLDKTLRQQGFDVVPYHLNTPSLNDTAFLLARRSSAPAGSLADDFRAIAQLRPEPRVTSAELIVATTLFGNNLDVDPSTVEPNSPDGVRLMQYFWRGWRTL